jgi:anthranilate/para-aminobenzoate synthase component II
MLLVIDNYDSFTFNLVQFLGDLGAMPVVVRNDERSVDELARWARARRRLSGAVHARRGRRQHRRLSQVRAGGCTHARRLPRTPEPGRGLRRPDRSRAPHHARQDRTGATRRGRDLRGIPSPFVVARYHSLVSDATALPAVLEPVAWSTDPEDEGEIQAMRHRDFPVWGVQFHPESLFSEHGKRLLENFLRI